MLGLRTTSAVLVGLAAAAGLAGCSGDDAGRPAAEGHAAGTGTGKPARDPEVAKALAQLTPADRALAEQQEVCPVTGEPLGSMGTPIKVTVEGQEVFVCCEGCVDAVKESPDKYLSKLKQTSPSDE